jgi:hydroxymethylpyrimidine pyrophosphatase-like HAD family hydrolase
MDGTLTQKGKFISQSLLQALPKLNAATISLYSIVTGRLAGWVEWISELFAKYSVQIAENGGIFTWSSFTAL